jgi:hypothetical protein
MDAVARRGDAASTALSLTQRNGGHAVSDASSGRRLFDDQHQELERTRFDHRFCGRGKLRGGFPSLLLVSIKTRHAAPERSFGRRKGTFLFDAFIKTKKVSFGSWSPRSVRCINPASPEKRTPSAFACGWPQSCSDISAPSGRSQIISLTSVPGMVCPWRNRLRWKTIWSRRNAMRRRVKSSSALQSLPRMVDEVFGTYGFMVTFICAD